MFQTPKYYWQLWTLPELAQSEDTLKWTRAGAQPHQPSCGTLPPLVEPQLGHHGGQTGSPHSRHEERLLAELWHTQKTPHTLCFPWMSTIDGFRLSCKHSEDSQSLVWTQHKGNTGERNRWQKKNRKAPPFFHPKQAETGSYTHSHVTGGRPADDGHPTGDWLVFTR